MIELGYSLSNRFPDPPQTDYRSAGVRELRYDLFCGDVHVEDEESDLSTAWGWVPVLDFAWALCDIVEELDRDPDGGRAARVQTADLDFTQNTHLLRFARRFNWVEVTATWLPDEPPVVVRHTDLRREARDFLQDTLADLFDMHPDLADNPVVWELQGRFRRV
ncbi:hypothetical protein WN990_34545 [Kitasatospora purpeofusca]|uniref:hypothetical protein n=1 Tax=Kitasatospora purpeofusca TaxID=67352 RepID=UPI00225416F0|nr:hypothetical protein [Kitasatospora purpeofusca]MCX4753644.1 hypothetical protein [Kitasatospora purpeofusca]WSR33133.1 hypothetical protein OG715_20315 [Kitasatospora purpeofusca]WSR41207.1 hypothetical protein OG196_20045 [Kitasatospora purpeofusca]